MHRKKNVDVFQGYFQDYLSNFGTVFISSFTQMHWII
jgi:hypothetical protein